MVGAVRPPRGALPEGRGGSRRAATRRSGAGARVRRGRARPAPARRARRRWDARRGHAAAPPPRTPAARGRPRGWPAARCPPTREEAVVHADPPNPQHLGPERARISSRGGPRWARRPCRSPNSAAGSARCPAFRRGQGEARQHHERAGNHEVGRCAWRCARRARGDGAPARPPRRTRQLPAARPARARAPARRARRGHAQERPSSPPARCGAADLTCSSRRPRYSLAPSARQSAPVARPVEPLPAAPAYGWGRRRRPSSAVAQVAEPTHRPPRWISPARRGEPACRHGPTAPRGVGDRPPMGMRLRPRGPPRYGRSHADSVGPYRFTTLARGKHP